MFCTECGTNNPETNHFCKNCGRPLKHAPSAPSPAGPVRQQAAVLPQAGSGTGRPAGASANAHPAHARDIHEFTSSLMTVEEFKTMSGKVPLKKRPQRWWDLLCIMGGIAAAVIWFFYGGLREGFDWLSSLLMIAIPVILVWLRPDIDLLLLPLQPARRKVPRILLIGLGIAIPFLTAWILYNTFHITQYSLMQANIVVGTLAAYAITRNPRAHPARRQEPVKVVPAVLTVVSAVLLISVLAVPVIADDCTRDPLNARDCLRTSGFAEGMAGLIAAILSGLVNGPVIIQGLLQGGETGEEETEEGEEEKDEGGVSIRLTYPAGYSPRVFSEGWFFGASARIGDKDVSDSVRWSGAGASFTPDIGRISFPKFEQLAGPQQITLSVMTEKGDVSKTFIIDTVNPYSYARVSYTVAKCFADAHGCPACPHPVTGKIITGSPTIRIGGLPAARVGDTGVHAACCGPNTFEIITGDPTVLIDGRPAAHKGSVTKHCGGMGELIN